MINTELSVFKINLDIHNIVRSWNNAHMQNLFWDEKGSITRYLPRPFLALSGTSTNSLALESYAWWICGVIFNQFELMQNFIFCG